MTAGVFEAASLDELVQALRGRGYEVHAPVLRQGALVIRPIEAAADLPRGIVDEQDAGTHRLRHDESGRYFDYTAPADSWKRLFFPARLRVWTAALAESAVTTAEADDAPPRLALLGVRGCDLAAIRVQDRVFMGGAHPDPHYQARREGAFIVAVNCARATSTCFCASMGTGPGASGGQDLSLTELPDGRFHVASCSAAGEAVLASLPAAAAATVDEDASAAGVVAATAATIRRTMPEGIAATLARAFDSPRWQAVADRCLACGNCTMVCPTCFCSAVEHTTDLAGNATQERRWDTCFSAGHSYIHGGSVRGSTAPRYRQWLTHKLSTWHDQFGMSGCTGCGRCIAWCPAAIDITQEAHAFTADAAGGRT